MKSHIIILIDNSYSMVKYQPSIITGLNNFIYQLKVNKAQDDVYISVVLFTDSTEYLCKAMNIKEIGIFEPKHFSRSGTTALYDVIGEIMIEWMNQILDVTTLYVISDGDDTNSKNYTKESIEKLSKLLIENVGWKIVHCDTDVSKMKNSTKNITYELDDIDGLFNKMAI